MRRTYLVLLLALFVLAGCNASDTSMQPETPPQTQPETQTQQSGAQPGDVVAVQYTGTLENESIFDESQQPLEFRLGQGTLLPAFEEQVQGMQVGEQKTFTLQAADAYGVRTNQTQEIALEEFGEQQVEEGMVISVVNSQTQQAMPAQIIEVGEENATLDLNHPLAGEDLTFAITVVEIGEAPQAPDMPAVTE